jgi:hypothetical protein
MSLFRSLRFSWLIALIRLYQTRWQTLFLVLATLMIALVAQEGFEHAQVNHFRDQSVQLPILYSYADQHLFPDDILLEARVTYVTWLYPILGWMSRVIPLQILMFGLYLVSVGLTISAIYHLAEDLFPQRYVGVLAVLLWAAWLPNPGGDFLRSSFPTHTTTAVGLQLWGLVLALRGQHRWGAVLIGLAININAMTGVFLSIVWAFGLLADYKKFSWRWLEIPVIMLLMALPTLWWKFGTGATEQSIPMEHFVSIMRTRLWYAIFPFSVDMHLWLAFGAVLGVWVYSARFATPDTNHKVFWMMQGIVLLVVIGTVFTELYPVELVMELQLLRSTWVLNLFAMLYFANMIGYLVQGNRWQVGLAMALTILLAAPRLVIELLPIAQPTPYNAYLDLNPIQHLPTPTWQGAAGLIALTLALAWVGWRMLPKTDLAFTKRLVSWVVFAAILFAAPMFVNTAIPAEQASTAEDWRDTLVWIREHTAQDAKFITPPTMDGFRVYAQRTHFSDWKDGTLLIFNAELADEWLYRMKALGFDETTFEFHTPTQAQLCQIAGQYEMDYAVVLLEWGITGQAVYENGHFAVIPSAHLGCASEAL